MNMTLEKLKKRIQEINDFIIKYGGLEVNLMCVAWYGELKGIRQAVEAIESSKHFKGKGCRECDLWEELKVLLK